MKTFYIYTHPVYGEKIESDGFTFLGFFFTIFWLFFKKLYRPFAYVLFVFIALSTVSAIVDLRIEQSIVLREEILNEADEEIAKHSYFRELFYLYIENGLDEDQAFEKAKIEYAQSQTSSKNSSIIRILIFCLLTLLQFYIGKNGRSWVLNDLERRGFKLKSFIYAENKDAMLAELYQEQSGKKK